MAKEWILNTAINRWRLQRKDMVGAVAEKIRKCSPKTLEEWESYYYKNVHPKKHLEEIGKKLYIKITKVLQAEINDITEQDCIEYVINLVINRTFDGYITEKKTVYEQLQNILNIKIEPAPDEWDRKYNVDFYIKIKDFYIGLQIKPISHNFITQLPIERKNQTQTHSKFTEEYGGKVFYIYSLKEGDRKNIYNSEVIDEINKEIERLSKL
ncbi:MAG: MjaI family restriction endonuclease [Brevinematales bacterium]|nr:MjaI family restriction endonuclease [Brevinematales bacterium]